MDISIIPKCARVLPCNFIMWYTPPVVVVPALPQYTNRALAGAT